MPGTAVRKKKKLRWGMSAAWRALEAAPATSELILKEPGQIAEAIVVGDGVRAMS